MKKEKEFKITKEKILAMASECSEVEAVLKKGFPEAFKKEPPKACCDQFALALKQKGMGRRAGSWVQLMGKYGSDGERDFLYVFSCPYCKEDFRRKK